MKVLLLQPLVSSEKLWGKYSKEGGLIPPIGLLSIGGYLESKGYFVRIIDPLVSGYDENKLRKILKKENFDLIGIPIFTNTVMDTYNTVDFCKKVLPKTKIIIGGVHATVLPIRTMEECGNIDFLAVGEGELTIEEVLKYMENGKIHLKDIKGLVYRLSSGKIVQNQNRKPLDINILPLPSYHLLDMSKYIPHPTQYKVTPSYPVIAQRGCPYNCAFCSAHFVHGKKVRLKSVELLVKEIKYLIDEYGARGIHFQDSTFTVNREYIIDFCQEIKKRGLKFKWDINTRVDCVDEELLITMKEAGLWMINFGLESGNQQSLDLLNKKITLEQIEKTIKMVRENSIVSFSTWILGLPGENEEMVKRTIKFAKKIGTELALFFLPVPYPKTELVNLCIKDKGFRNDVKWGDYSSVDFSNPVYINPLLGKEKMQKYLKNAFLSYYLSPKIIWRNLRAIESKDDILRYLRGFRALVYGWII